MTVPTKTARTAVSNVYVELVRAFPLRPLESEADLIAAIKIIDGLIGRERLPEEADYLHVLAILVHAYEAEHDPLPEMTGLETLRSLIVDNGLTQAQLSKQTGIPETTLCEVLSGKRGISAKVRTALAKRFKMSPSSFV